MKFLLFDFSSHVELVGRLSYTLFQNDEFMALASELFSRQKDVVTTSRKQKRNKSILKYCSGVYVWISKAHNIQQIVFHSFEKQFATRLRRHLIFHRMSFNDTK